MKLTSPAFGPGETIPVVYTEDGQDISPPLVWESLPAETQSLALICDDPDAPSRLKPAPQPWVHWVIYDIPANLSGLPEGVGRTPEPAEVPGARQGINSWPTDNLGYRGPAPPPGSGPHRYFFKLYALDSRLDLPAGATKAELIKAISGHVVGESQLFGVYER